MKIAIYGDSFASCIDGWPKYFQDFYKKSDIHLFGVGGTSANFSYMRFLETHERYDMVIFLWTSINRNCLISRDHKRKTYKIYGFTATIREFDSDIDELRKCLKDTLRWNLIFNKSVKDNIKEYDVMEENWIANETFYSLKYESKNFLDNIAMRDSVKLKRPDSINIECFPNTDFPNLSIFKHEYGMCNINFYDWLQFGHELGKNWENEYNEVPEKRPNHFTHQQNKEFAAYMYKQINQQDFDIHKTFAKPEKFYTMSKTLEEGGFVV